VLTLVVKTNTEHDMIYNGLVSNGVDINCIMSLCYQEVYGIYISLHLSIGCILVHCGYVKFAGVVSKANRTGTMTPMM